MFRSFKMSTKKIAKPVSKYKRYTPVQLATTIRQLQKQYISVAKKWNKNVTPVQSKAIQSQCAALATEIRKVATVLRLKIVKLINDKIRTLRTTHAKNLGIRVTSPKSASTAVRRLKAKIALIKKANRASALISFSTGLKLAQFKNPAVSGVARTRVTTRTRTSTRGKTRSGKPYTRTTSRTRTTVKGAHVYKRQTKTLKKELHKLKKRNSFMRRLVNQFRKKVAKLQRSYRAANTKPRWKVVHGKGSNVVRINRGTSTNWSRQSQRRAG